MISPFDFINAITYTKEDLIIDSESREQYNPYIINRGLSMNLDTIEVSNKMNMNPNLDKKSQFDFFINSIRSRKRFPKWFKKKGDDDLSCIMSYYGYNIHKAQVAISILSTDQIIKIKELLASKE